MKEFFKFIAELAVFVLFLIAFVALWIVTP